MAGETVTRETTCHCNTDESATSLSTFYLSFIYLSNALSEQLISPVFDFVVSLIENVSKFNFLPFNWPFAVALILQRVENVGFDSIKSQRYNFVFENVCCEFTLFVKVEF